MIDLRSDTLTRPTKAMLQAMQEAKVGDDVFGEDPSINALEKQCAQIFGFEAALFCPSGTMANQIAINVHTRPGEEVICHHYSHVYNYEGGGIAFNSGCQVRPVEGPAGKMEPAALRAALQNPRDLHASPSRLVVAENTTNKGGGACYSLAELQALRLVCEENKLAFHLDGARLWNALEAMQQEATAYGQIFDSISVCLSKGLGCPVGSVLLGKANFIDRARFVRKKMGGGMRQAGYLAAAGIYALHHHRHRLVDDHRRAQLLVKALKKCTWVDRCEAVETNIVIFYLQAHRSAEQFSERLREAGILHTGMGQGKLRFVTHLDIDDQDIEKVAEVLAQFS